MSTALRQVTAKFKVHNRRESNWGTLVEMSPDYLDGRNKEWSAATPAGGVNLTIKNELAAEFFQLGDAITVVFEKGE